MLFGCGFQTDEAAFLAKQGVTAKDLARMQQHHYITVDPIVDIPVGAIIKESNLDPQRGEFWSTEEEGFITDPEQAIGHVAMKPLHAGSNIRLSDINP